MKEANLTSSANHNLEHMYEELQQRATIDALSGVLNRATLEQCIKKRLETVEPSDTCALFIVDLDDFKQVNDTLGHQAGDQAIRRSAQILSGLFRASDIVGRLGGDEFAIFLCGQVTEELVRKKGTAICENLQLALGDHPVVNLTTSVGISLAEGRPQFEEMYQSADLALYRAKKAGKHGFYLHHGAYSQEKADDFHPVNTISLSGLLEYMNSGVALLEMSESPQVIYVSPSFYRIIGAKAPAYSLPLPLSSLIHPDDQLGLEETLWEGLRQGQPVEHTHRVSSGDGQRWLWWHVRAIRIRYDNPHPVLLVTTTDVSHFKENEQQLEAINQRLQVAFGQTAQRLWEVDIASHTFHFFGQDGLSQNPDIDGAAFPAQLVEAGWVHPNSAARFQTFAKELLSGQANGYGNFILKHQSTGCYGWATLSYRMLFDDVGHAVKAVGIVEDLSGNLAGQNAGRFGRWPLPEGLLSDLMVHMRANLTQDRIEELWVEGKSSGDAMRQLPCSAILAQEQSKIFSGDAQGDLPSYFRCEQLLRLYQEGRRWLTAEYRRADSGGNIRWVRCILHLASEPLTHCIHLYAYLIQIDRLRQWEQACGRPIIRDIATQLYDRATVERMANAMFHGQHTGDRAVVLFQIDGLAHSQPPGRHMPDQLHPDIAAALSLALGGSCLLGQYSPTRILALFPAITSKDDLRRRLEEAVAFVQQALSSMAIPKPLRFITGVATSPADAADFHTLLSKALHVCGLWWNAALDTVAFASEEEEGDWAPLQADEPDDQVSIHSAEMERPLSEGEKEVAFHCMSTMLSADSLEVSLRGVLHTIGSYYQADRVYILTLAEKSHVVTMPFEWTGPHKRSIQQAVSGMRLERFPLLERCLAERKPLFLTRSQPIAARGGKASSEPWYFTAFPLIQQNRVEGFLCIENSREHPADAALFGALIPYILHERKRFHHSDPAPGTVEQLMGLPDLRSYMKAIYTLNSEQYSSLGAVCLDIPGMAAINGSLGFEYGNQLLWYVSKTLTDIFGTSLLFRTWDAEFIAFCPNTTRQVFLGRCGRLRSILQRRYPKEVRLGRAWADGIFSGKLLADEARHSMHLCYLEQEPPSAFPLPGSSFPVGESACSSRFTVYFQPKIHIGSGALVGMEALVRGVEKNGIIIPPGQFIGALEERGGIRELDLFVLERALSQVEQWRAAGLGIVPVSVNLSRVTLVHPSTLASVLAIQSRFPQLPAEALELEITESAGTIEASDLREIADKFRSNGLRLSLDDFGSQYANLPLFTNVQFDTVKLDRSLITELATNPINQMLVRDIIQICRARDMTCVAEGVENQEQIAALLETGCNYAQGYYYDQPLPAHEFEQKYLQGNAPAESKP